MGGPPIVEVNYDELTYEMLVRAQADENRDDRRARRPSGPIDRIVTDLLGAVVLYFATFVVCDIIRTIYTGRWTKLIMSVLGPWNALTGAPLLHKFTKIFDHVTSSSRAIDACNDRHDAAVATCRIKYNPIDWVVSKDYQQCMDDADNAQYACIEKTPEYKDCYNSAVQSYYTYGIPPSMGGTAEGNAQNDCLNEFADG